MPDVLKRHIRWMTIAGLLLGLAATHAQRLPMPETIPPDATPELRAGNRIAVWLVEIHLAALAEVLPAP